MKIRIYILSFALVVFHQSLFAQWASVGPESFDSTDAPSSFPFSMICDNHGKLYIGNTYFGMFTENPQIWSFSGGSWSSQIVPLIGQGRNPIVGFDDLNTLYVASKEDTVYSPVYVQNTISVLKYGVGGWQYINTPGFTPFGSGDGFFFVVHNNTPYLSFKDDLGNATIVKYNGSGWDTVGPPNFCTVSSVYPGEMAPRLAFDNTGAILAAFNDRNQGDSVVVYKLSGSTWAQLGNVNCSNQLSSHPFVTDKNGTPYILLEGAYNALVKKYDGSNWDSVGNIAAGYPSGGYLTIDTGNTLYIASGDAYTSQDAEATVTRFDGSNWVAVCDTNVSGHSIGAAGSTPLITIDKSGIVYVSYADAVSQYMSANSCDPPAIATGINNYATTEHISVMPNPFSHHTMLSFDLPEASDVSIRVYDDLGREIENHSGQYGQGKNKLDICHDLQTGVYSVLLTDGRSAQTLRVVAE